MLRINSFCEAFVGITGALSLHVDHLHFLLHLLVELVRASQQLFVGVAIVLRDLTVEHEHFHVLGRLIIQHLHLLDLELVARLCGDNFGGCPVAEASLRHVSLDVTSRLFLRSLSDAAATARVALGLVAPPRELPQVLQF